MPIDQRAHERINNVEEAIRIMQVELTKNTRDQDIIRQKLDKNTEMTQHTYDNTNDLITLIKGGKILSKLLIWASSIAAFGSVIYNFWNK
jgi:hypothetical protein